MPPERERLLQEIRGLRNAMMRAGSPMGRGGPWMELDLTIAQLRVTFCLAGQPPMTMSAIAQQMGVTLPAATNVVDKLVRAGLVARHENPSDRRFVRCSLTEQGQTLTQRLHQSGPLASDELFDRMTVAELRTTAKAIAIFNRVLSELDAEHTQNEGKATSM